MSNRRLTRSDAPGGPSHAGEYRDAHLDAHRLYELARAVRNLLMGPRPDQYAAA